MMTSSRAESGQGKMRAGRGKDFPRRSLTLGSLGTSAGAVPSLSLKCLIIAPGGTGVFDPVSGIGTGLIDWGDSYERSFESSFFISP